MKKYFIPILLLLVIFGACNQNQKKGKLSLKLESENPKHFSYKFSEPKYGTILFIDKNNVLRVYYVENNSNNLVAMDLSTGDKNVVYEFKQNEKDSLVSFNYFEDSIVLLFDKKVSLVVGNKVLFNYPVIYEPNVFFKTDINRRPIIYFRDNFILGYGLDNNEPLLDKYSHLFFVKIKDNQLVVNNKVGLNAQKLFNGYHYFNGTNAVLGKQKLYFYPEIVDSMLIYDWNNLDSVEHKISIFDDLEKKKEKDYDTTKNTDLVYLKKYILTTEINLPIYQQQESNQAYILKRKGKEKIEDDDVYILGLVRDNQYLGYVSLPEDFNDNLHLIVNNDLYYISTKEKKWKKYSIHLE